MTYLPPDPSIARRLLARLPAPPHWPDRPRSALGAAMGLALTGMLCSLILGGGLANPLLIGAMGASAVLAFAMPASPLAQPWPLVGGNVVSALIGAIVAHLVPDRTAGAAMAIAAAIVVMSLLRCLHPPAGGIAIAASLGGAASAPAQFTYALAPVGVNCLVLVTAAWLFHRMSGHSYPHRAPIAEASPTTRDPPALDRVGIAPRDIDDALAAYGEDLDVEASDLRLLFKDTEVRAATHDSGARTCADIMSRDLVTVESQADARAVRALLQSRKILSLPVIDTGGRVAGIVTALGLAEWDGPVEGAIVDALMVDAAAPMTDLVRPLSEGRHEALVVDEDRRLLGMITQTDMIAALAVPSVA